MPRVRFTRLTPLVLALAGGLSGAACEGGQATPDVPAPGEAGPARLTPAQAVKAVRAHLFGPGAANDLTLRELTTDQVWKRLGVQVFQVASETREGETFVIRRGRVIPIGRAFGGPGVTSLCVADLKRDGRPWLFYSFAWGSGVHRSQVGALDCLAAEPKEVIATPANFSFADFFVGCPDDRTVRVTAGGRTVGQLELTDKGGKTQATIRLEKDLPKEIRDALK
jgi:hypothetical protein